MNEVRKTILISLTLLFAFLGGMRCGSSTNTTIPPGAIAITIQSGAAGTTGIYGTAALGPGAYGTNPLHVPLGAKVVWKNGDSMTHTATSDTGIWNTGMLGEGAVSAITTFSTKGTFPYHCTVHGVTAMSGTIVVP